MNLDLIEHKQFLFPECKGLPSSMALIHRGGNYLYNRTKGKIGTGDVVSLVTEGNAVKGEFGEFQTIGPGALYVSFGDEPTFLQSYEKCPHRVIAFFYHNKSACRQLREVWRNKRIIPDATHMIRHTMETMRYELLNMMAFRSSLLSVYHQSLMLMIARETSRELHEQDPVSNLHNRAMHLINCFPEDHPTLYELSEKLGISREHLIRTFKLKGDSSPYQLLLKSRMVRAGDWLESTNWSVAEISEKLGYNNAASFIRSYKKVVGMTPNQRRKKSHIV